jgi:hypothetical protein
MSWKRLGRKAYKRHAGNMVAYVFASPSVWLWGWACYWPRGSSSGVAHSFRKAKEKADETARQITTAASERGEG